MNLGRYDDLDILGMISVTIYGDIDSSNLSIRTLVPFLGDIFPPCL